MLNIASQKSIFDQIVIFCSMYLYYVYLIVNKYFAIDKISFFII